MAISKRGALQCATAAVMAVSLCGVLGACSSSSEAIYEAGTYSASATGKGGEITATITFDDTSITAVELDLSCETETIGQAAGDTLIEEILEAQSADIDMVSGATLTSTAVIEATEDCIAQATIADSE